MKKFNVQVGRDARVYFTATVEAMSLQDAQNMLSRHGYECPDHVEWTHGVDDFDQFDLVETCVISDPDTDEVLANYHDNDGWQTGEEES